MSLAHFARAVVLAGCVLLGAAWLLITRDDGDDQ